MIICEIDNIQGRSAPPTPQAIERDRNQQLQSLKDLRRRLLLTIKQINE